MNVEFSAGFERELSKIKDKNLLRKIITVIDRVKNAQTPADIPNLKKLKGHKIYYRIRIGNYRLGISIESELVAFSTVEHRASAYQTFPPQ